MLTPEEYTYEVDRMKTNLECNGRFDQCRFEELCDELPELKDAYEDFKKAREVRDRTLGHLHDVIRRVRVTREKKG